METKKYYAITTSMKFEKTVLVPVNQVEDIDDAIDLVDSGVEVARMWKYQICRIISKLYYLS